MDFDIFNNVLEWIKNKNYKYTWSNDDKDEWGYGLTLESICNDNNKSQLNNIISGINYPDVHVDLYLRDFIIVTTEIYKEGDVLKIFVDTDECDFINEYKKMSVFIGGYKECVDIKKYYMQTFIDYKLDDIDDFVNSIEERKDYVLTKECEYPNDDNLVFVQINVIMHTKLNKYIKQEKSNIFFVNNGFLSTKKNNKIKDYINLSMFVEKKQQEIVDIINSYYQNLTIIKKPYTNEIIFGIKGQEFIRRVWNKYEGIFYPVINENIKL